MKRKRLSIKTRVTLWYTTLLAVLVGLVVAAVLVMSDSTAVSYTHLTLPTILRV